MGLSVKKIKGKLYVYEHVKLPDGRKLTLYIGPLEEMVRLYQAKQAELTVNSRIPPRVLRRLGDYIVVNLLEKLEEKTEQEGFEEGLWGRRRDLNPGPRGPQPRALPNCATAAAWALGARSPLVSG